MHSGNPCHKEEKHYQKGKRGNKNVRSYCKLRVHKTIVSLKVKDAALKQYLRLIETESQVCI